MIHRMGNVRNVIRQYGRINTPKRFQRWFLNSNSLERSSPLDVVAYILRTTRTLVYYHYTNEFEVHNMPIKKFTRIYSRRNIG